MYVLLYRPWQPEHTMWKLQDFFLQGFYVESILVILKQLWILSFRIFSYFQEWNSKKFKFKASKIVELTVLDPLNLTKIDFT